MPWKEASAHGPPYNDRLSVHLDGVLRVRLRGEPVVASAEVRHLQGHVPRLVSSHVHVVCTDLLFVSTSAVAAGTVVDGKQHDL